MATLATLVIPAITPIQRADMSEQIRDTAAQNERNLPIPTHPDNGDETLYHTKVGNYSKGLPHNSHGEVDLNAYQSMLTAMNSGNVTDFENIVLGGAVPLVDPQAGLAYDLEGTDSHQLSMPPAPALISDVKAAEAVELYWMALMRDIPFDRYAFSELAEEAAMELSSLPAFSRLLSGVHQPVTAANLFRGFTDGDLKGPYISQFLYQTLEFGAAEIVQRFQTLLPLRDGGTDWMTDFPSWLDCQNGAGTLAAAWKTPSAAPNRIDPVRRYIRRGRDICQYVHVDVLFEAYFNACLYLIHNNAPLNPGNPYITSKTQTGFGTFGSPHIKTIIAEVSTRALKAVWFQKWFVHRHLRPEAYGGLVHNALTGYQQEETLPSSILNSKAVERCFFRNGTYLMPHAFPEGCPQHPSYGQGHGTVAGACTTVIKAFFDETWQIPNPVVPSEDGLSLLNYTGPDTLMVGGEVDKLAANIALGRNHAAVHWRSDYAQAVLLGEQVAISVLKDQLKTFNELPRIQTTGWSFTGFGGNTVTLV
ncbi:MAG: vanadium-dependent haloperoxidase [Bryobacteraceae bacterium]